MDEKSLNRKRGGLKASLTNFTKFIQGIKQKNEALNDEEVRNVNERIARLENVFIEFLEVQNQIEIIVNQENLDEQYSERAAFENNYFEYLALAKNLLPQEFSVNEQQSSQSSSKSDSGGHSNENANSVKISVKLPDIPLPTFGGSFDRWLEFRDTFESLINENRELSGIQKFHYLRASLEGKAAEVIKSVEFSEHGYPVAWNALVERFNNKKLLIHNHLKAIFSLESISKENSTKLRGLIDEVSKHLSSINQLGQDTSNWDTLLIFMLSSKLDHKTNIDWEKTSASSLNPTLQDFSKFLQGRADVLETIEYKGNTNRNKSDFYSKKDGTRSLVAKNIACYFCNKEHSIYSCQDFANLSTNEKKEFVKKKKLCVICLRDNHFGKRCIMGPCKKCKAWHNSLLHEDPPVENQQENSKQITVAVSKRAQNQNYVFLATAKVKVYDINGQAHCARVLLDCGSQSSFISSELCERLGLEKYKTNISVQGISNLTSNIKNKCLVQIYSLNTKFKTSLACFILPEITSISSASNIDKTCLNIPDNLPLADPDLLKPGNIDILIGAELFWVLLESKRISCGTGLPYLQETKLGWILAGMLGNQSNVSKLTCCHSSINFDLQNLLSRFWEIEEVGTHKALSKEEIECEKIFSETTTRDAYGRFTVTLPLKQSAECLGKSREQAEKRFYSIERKLNKNKEMREYYIDFMEEYARLNHMTQCHDNHEVEYFMPHHGVFREDSSTTKLRVVFDASAPTSNGLSLNNIQLIGPVLQDDLLSILLRFRKHAFVISADVAKMYRQVLITPSQRNLQKIFWRSSPSEDLKVYTLNTVTYGHASASFLAIRCLFELANECNESSPAISDIIRHDFYVDDLLTGSDTIEEAQYICHEIAKVFKSGGFELRKWHSNKLEVLKTIQQSDASCGILEFAPEEKSKTLGLTWSSQSDVLLYNVKQVLNKEKCTKRSVLSLSARIFDPLGLVSPCTIIAKIFMQRLWCEKISWDDELPHSLASEWFRFCEDLVNLNKLEIHRRVICDNAIKIELHGFADSSERAYGACIYLRSIDRSNDVQVSLLCAKSKVAPVKCLTIPKLELCGALLLSRLANKVINSLKIKLDKCIFWSDSTVTLAWLQTTPNFLKVFVSNRVAEIQTLTEDYEWRYVPTQDNPTDFVSRGLLPSQILKTPVWWSGPPWLAKDPSQWPSICHKVESLPELKPQRISSFPASIEYDFPFERFSSFVRLQRITAFILRFKNNCSKDVSKKNYASLTMSELRNALKSLIKAAQGQSFPNELAKLSEGTSFGLNTKIKKLTQFLDEDNIIRVGGRLKHSDFWFEKKHPIMLHSKHHFTKLIFEYEHVCLLHPGPQLLLSCIRDKFWPIGGRNLARTVTRKCLRCFRFRPSHVEPIMGDLPRERTVPTSPFYATGIDYAGPFLIRKNRRTVEKCYVCVFICLSTKALHLELVSSLSSQAFIQCLRRFVSRRGKPAKIFSDNGTTFVGANRELGQFLKNNKNELESLSLQEKIEWSFIPPYSPHFGGLWEAGVKSVKHHLKRVLANASLIFEEFVTILNQIEAILNSRPICPLSSDPNDFSPLTPAHFLIGRPLVAVPDQDVQNLPVNRLTRFQLLQQICQHFWKRWKQDYIAELQQRQRWKTSQGQLSEGTLVLIKEDHTSPTEWKLGRIVKLHPGSDGVSRVASIRTTQGVVKRSFPRICPLPTDV